MIHRADHVGMSCLVTAAVVCISSMLDGCVVLSRQQEEDWDIRIKQTHAYVKRIDDTVETVNSQVSQAVDESVRTRANTEAVLDELRTELQKTQSVVEENTFRLSEFSRKLDELRVNLYRKLGIGRSGPTLRQPAPQSRPGVPVPSAPAETLPSIPGMPVPAAPAEAPPTRPVSPQDDYQRVYRDYQKGNYELAKLGFKQYLSTYPNSEDADNAQFWLAQCYYKTGDNKTALAETQRLYKGFPESPKIPDAMLIEAFIEVQRGNQSRAQTILKQLIADYPTTEAAKGAKRKLDAIAVGPSN